MLAVIQTGGKQRLVRPGDILNVEKLPGEAGQDFVFDQVLLVANDDGSEVQIGTPYLLGKSVTATVEAQGRAKKIRVIKFKRKVRYKRTRGHRQQFTRVRVKEIK